MLTYVEHSACILCVLKYTQDVSVIPWDNRAVTVKARNVQASFVSAFLDVSLFFFLFFFLSHFFPVQKKAETSLSDSSVDLSGTRYQWESELGRWWALR